MLLRALWTTRRRLPPPRPTAYTISFFSSKSTKSTKSTKTIKSTKSSKEQYKRLDPVSHVLLRPGMYVGSIARQKQQLWLPTIDADQKRTTMLLQDASYVPALYKIFDEIIVNAADNYQRDSTMTCIDVTFNSKKDMITIRNDGKGIPVRMHETEKVYVPELVLGNLLTGSNFDDTEGRLTGGAHGFGAKLTNIFSTTFIVETADTKRKKLYKQTWTNNMRTRGEPDITPLPSTVTSDYTMVSFTPDFPRFGIDNPRHFWNMSKTSSSKSSKGTVADNTLQLMLRRVWDVAGVNSSLKVTIDGKTLDVDSFMDYVQMFREKDTSAESTTTTTTTTSAHTGLYLRPNRHWEIVVGASTDAKFQQVSFVNSISTLRGGTHVNVMVEQLCRRIADYTNRVHGKDIPQVTSSQVRNHLQIFVSSLIENPSFDSQLKESLTTPSNKFGSNPVLSERFTKLVISNSGIVESVVDWARAKERVHFLGQLKTTGKKSSTRLLGIPKLEDANDAGDPSLGKECTLILTEGDSAKALAVAGLAVVGRDKYGVFPLRGKPLNVRDASLAQIGGNEEIKNLIQILGLEYDKTYEKEEDYENLRYGSIMIMADQDHDGSHIKGLLLNALHVLFPSLLERDGFVKAFVTPIVKVKRKRKRKILPLKDSPPNERSFYSLADYEQWRAETFRMNTEGAAGTVEEESGANNASSSITVPDTPEQWTVKYYKGLGTSTAGEAREYFSQLNAHVKPFRWGGSNDGERLDMAFRKSRAEDRKRWLSRSLPLDNLSAENNGVEMNVTRTDMDLNSQMAIDEDGTTMASFVDNELVLFSHADNIRSIPSVVDGLKPSQRKVLYACFKRKLTTTEIKVAQLAGYVSEHTAYHHGEASLQSTITNMAQTFVGANNLPLLYPSGQFGTRLQGGKDAASPRYIFTKLMPAARKLFPMEDDPLLDYRDDDGYVVEPIHYVPIIPMALVNGCDGIGTGWSTSVPMYNPMDLIDWIDAKIYEELGATSTKKTTASKTPLQPWVRGFTGTMEELPMVKNSRRFKSTGIIEQINANTLEITELPIGRWTDDMKKVLATLVRDSTVKGYREHHTEDKVHFIINMTRNKIVAIDASEGGFEKIFKLEETINTSNMHLFNAQGVIHKYDTAEDILEAYYPVRRAMYAKRRQHQLRSMSSKLVKLENKAKFLEMVSNGDIVLIGKSKADLENDLIAHQFIPEHQGGAGNSMEDLGDDDTTGEDEDGEDGDHVVKNTQNFDYLLRTPLSSITIENVEATKKETETLRKTKEQLENTHEVELWQHDLQDLRKTLGKEYEAKAKTGTKRKKRKTASAKKRRK